jgi:hypothetical protein
MDTFIVRVIDALLWLIVGMALMARFYTVKYNLAGADAIGWDTVAIVIGGVVGARLLLLVDPAFRSK